MNKVSDITSFLYGGRQEVENKFDAKFRDRIQESIQEIARLFEIMEPPLLKSDDPSFPDGTLNAGLILWKCLKTIIASLQTWRCGYWAEAGTMIRSPLESAAVALLLHIKPEAIKIFREGKKSIYGQAWQEAYKIIPTLKGEKDLLSQIYVHPSEFDGVIEWKGGKISVVGEFDEAYLHRYRTALFVIEGVLMNIAMIIEYVFFKYCSNQTYWKLDASGTLERKSTPPAHLERFLEDVELIKKQTGIDVLEGKEDIKAVLGKIFENKKRRQESLHSQPTATSDII